jgi:cell wall-associated NlpC family hydrolase
MKVNLSDLINIPFKAGGNSSEGIDCYHLAQKVFKKYQIDIPDYIDACRTAVDTGLKSNTINREIDERRKDWIKIEEPIEPCLVVLRTSDNPSLCTHLGVYVGGGKFIHITKEKRSVLERITHPFWEASIEGFYLYNG